MKTICIEGWRGVNHSIAMVNQNQILEMLKEPGVRLFHRDVPYFMPHWNAKTHASGFSAAEQQLIDGLAAPDGERLDCVLRVSSPIRGGASSATKTLTYMVTEFGLSDKSFDGGAGELARYTRGDDRIVTPSRWSRDRLVDFGLDAERIDLVPHGVKTDTFFPMQPDERRAQRERMGLHDDDIVYANVGVATWNKGIDLLVLAFADLRRRGLPVRLLLKDHRGLYGIGVERVLQDVERARPGTLSEDVLGAISVVSASLDLPQLRCLYAAADAYVSPYRAEGFNLPVLEAMACGTHAIVTDGGATDDFCPDGLATRVASRRGRPEEVPAVRGDYCVPDLDALIAAMHCVADRRLPIPDPRQRRQLLHDYSWATVTRQLLALM